MTKEYTFARIAEILKNGGMDDSSVKKSIEFLKNKYAAEDEETFEETVRRSGGAEGMASKILSLYNRENADAPAEGKQDLPANEPVTAGEGENGAKDGEIYLTLPDDEDFDLPEAQEPGADADEADGQASEEDSSGEKTDDEKAGDLDILLDDEMFSDDGEPIKTDEQEDDGNSDAEEFFNDESDDESDGKDKSDKKSDKKKKKKKSKKGKKKKKPLSRRGRTVYTLVLIVLIPVIIALIAVITLLFLGLFAAIAALTIACSVALVIVAAVGTALSIVAIVYGVIQLSVAVPIGLYEMGLGIIVGGGTLAISILLYNFIVRLVPFLFRVLFIFYRFLCRQISRIIGSVRGACSKL